MRLIARVMAAVILITVLSWSALAQDRIDLFSLVKSGDKAERPSTAYRALQVTLAIGSGLDLGLTWASIKCYGLGEANPAADMFMSDFPTALAYTTVLTMATVALSDLCWHENRTLGWIVLAAAVVVKGFVVWHNVRMIEGR